MVSKLSFLNYPSLFIANRNGFATFVAVLINHLLMDYNFYELLKQEYDKITCPVCGTHPTFVIKGEGFVSHSCGHHECQLLMDEAEKRLEAKFSDDEPKKVKLSVRRPDFGE